MGTFSSSRELSTNREVEEFTLAITENRTEMLLNMIDSHPIRYFFNLRLDGESELTLFHKIILFDDVSMFNSALELFKTKFKEEYGSNNSKVLNSSIGSRESNSNSNVFFYQLEEKKTNDTENPNDLTLVKLLSLKDKEGNTPMLFAAYTGNIEIISELIELGVNFDVKNKAGLDVIQMAAQNDNSNVIVFFKEKYNYDLYQPDNEGNNSIHWASSNCAKNALEYLLFYINEKNFDVINKVNKNGQTALHLTILTNESLSIIKKLIKKGIDLNIRDKYGLTALDISKNNPKYELIKKTIIDYTQTNCLGLNYHINNFRNKYFKYASFIVFFILMFYSTNAFCLPYLEENLGNQISIKLIFNIISIIFVGYFIYIMRSDAGVIKEKKEESLLELVIQKKCIKKLCPICMVDQKNYSKHCFICNKCIEIYDHHCHWINNCIGLKNKNQFIGFLCLLLSIILIDYFICFQTLVTPMTQQYMMKNYIMSESLYKYIISGVMSLLSLFFFFPVSYIIYSQFNTEFPPKPKRNEVKEYYEELKEVNDKNSMVNQLQIKED